jgi:hypothetical protein
VDQSEIGTGETGGNAVIDSSGTGGGIHNSGDLLVTRSTLAGNVIDMPDPAGAIALGAGLYNGGRAAVASSTVSGNSIHPVSA